MHGAERPEQLDGEGFSASACVLDVRVVERKLRAAD
jgi:hypothetical protein